MVRPGPTAGNYFNYQLERHDRSCGSIARISGPSPPRRSLLPLATNAANTKLALTGGTITGNLQVNGDVGVNSNVFRFGAVGSSSGYLQWHGGGYLRARQRRHDLALRQFQSGVVGIVADARLAIAGEHRSSSAASSGSGCTRAFPGAVMIGWTWIRPGALDMPAFVRLQLHTSAKAGPGSQWGYCMNTIDHGDWHVYTPTTLPERAPEHALFARRDSDGVDWYDYVHDPAQLHPAIPSRLRCSIAPPVNTSSAPPPMTRPRYFQAGCIVHEVTDVYRQRSCKTDLGSKAFDPATGDLHRPDHRRQRCRRPAAGHGRTPQGA